MQSFTYTHEIYTLFASGTKLAEERSMCEADHPFIGTQEKWCPVMTPMIAIVRSFQDKGQGLNAGHLSFSQLCSHMCTFVCACVYARAVCERA